MNKDQLKLIEKAEKELALFLTNNPHLQVMQDALQDMLLNKAGNDPSKRFLIIANMLKDNLKIMTSHLEHLKKGNLK